MEARSPYTLHREFGESLSTRFYSWLMWLSGPMLLLNVWWIYRRKDPVLHFVAIASAMGLALMQSQFRFSVFGEVPMLLTPLLAARFLYESRPEMRRIALAACCALFAVAFYPTIANWQLGWFLGGSEAYANLRSTFPVLKALCAQRPGIVLGDLDTGHWVRYHSQCSVIANVFLLTPQHAAKVFESGQLLNMSPTQLLTAKPEVRYVFAHHSVMLKSDEKGEAPDLSKLRLEMHPLERDLLGPEANIPPQFKRRWEVRTPAGQIFARLYEIERTQ
jgi:hypothetical protein